MSKASVVCRFHFGNINFEEVITWSTFLDLHFSLRFYMLLYHMERRELSALPLPGFLTVTWELFLPA